MWLINLEYDRSVKWESLWLAMAMKEIVIQRTMALWKARLFNLLLIYGLNFLNNWAYNSKSKTEKDAFRVSLSLYIKLISTIDNFYFLKKLKKI